MSDETQWVINTTDATFEQDVLLASQQGLVVVDFWAEWCAPCRTLGPILEGLAEDYQGGFLLVKADTETNQAAAGEFSVSGIPAVFAVLDGEVVDSFQGAMPEPQVRQWINSLLRQRELKAAKEMLETSPDEAEVILRSQWLETPDDAAVAAPLAELLLSQGRTDECVEIIEQLEQRGFLEPEMERVKAAVELGSKADVDVEAARAAAAAAPNDFELQFTLAEALAGSEQYEASFEICLDLVSRDRHKTGEKARALMVDVFRVLPEGSELTSDYRRKLSMLLY
ncbi:tetratricopeptide repeat protein [Aureliella helgolandensis]|uniref:Thioredoxin-1 n=1 Tax=Aureliella helgolandensis TaxID=2527968 RepID=A0A518FZV4_9BACT|nr:tetratricopeptide repeat protein [Aureliella helgolandensis]QDV21846.1 Thioredoxin-1 [Aureliella helgolandensis]